MRGNAHPDTYLLLKVKGLTMFLVIVER